MHKRMIFGILLAVLLICPLLSGAETVTADSRIVALHSHFECGCEATKDGVMISEYGLVTKSNALYCATHGKKYTHITFYFGYVGDGKAVYQYDGEFKAHAYETFEGGYIQENDIGYVKFFEPVGDETGWYAVKAPSDQDLSGAALSYRINRITGIEEQPISTFTVTDKKFIYIPYTEGIASGLPVILPYEYAGDGYVVGIINSYVNTDTEQHCNIRRITSRVYNDMLSDGLFAEGEEFRAPRTGTVTVESTLPAADEPATLPAPAGEEPAATLPAPDGEPEVTALPAAPQTEPESLWTCPDCGQAGNFGNFCFNCGAAKPAEDAAAEWTCGACGQAGNHGNFCFNCGTPRDGEGEPAAEP